MIGNASLSSNTDSPGTGNGDMVGENQGEEHNSDFSDYDGATHDKHSGGKKTVGTKTTAGRKRQDRARELINNLRGVKHVSYSGVSPSDLDASNMDASNASRIGDVASIDDVDPYVSNEDLVDEEVKMQHDSWRNRWLQPIEVWSNRFREMIDFQERALKKQRMWLPENDRT